MMKVLNDRQVIATASDQTKPPYGGYSCESVKKRDKPLMIGRHLDKASTGVLIGSKMTGRAYKP